MAVRVAINGFGRIGRNVLRAIIESGRTDIEVVAINDLGPVETNAHLLRFDSVHGRFPHKVTVEGDTIDVGRGPIKVTAVRDPAELPHGDMGVDIALECTGIFTSKEKASAHLKAGAKKVIISAPGDGADKTIVYGINHASLTKDDVVISNASCTTNCLAPLAYVDEDLPLGNGRFLMEPMVFGRLLQEAHPTMDDAALLVGCGSGYAAVVLGKLCGAVFALESDSGLAARTTALISGEGADNVVTVEGPLEKGWTDEAPYSLILFDGAVAEVPQSIIDQLGENGRIAAVISDGDGPGRATMIEKRAGIVSRRTLFDANTPVLPDFAKSAGFVF